MQYDWGPAIREFVLIALWTGFKALLYKVAIAALVLVAVYAVVAFVMRKVGDSFERMISG